MTLYTSLPCLAFNGCGITSHDDFFGEMINCLPAQQYFPLADDDNHVFAKFHKNTKKTSAKAEAKEVSKMASKKAKRVKFNSKLQLKNTETQQATSTGSNPVGNSPSVSLDTLRQRLQSRIVECRNKRSINATSNQKTKRRKTSERVKKSQPNPAPSGDGDIEAPAAITYGNLLLNQDSLESAPEKEAKPRGQAGMRSLLRRVEANKRRMDELKKSTDGKQIAIEKQFSDAVKKAAGEKVLDDPKLIRKALKRKEKAKQKSTKQWKARIAAQQEESTGKASKKGTRKQRAGFEGSTGPRNERV